MWMYFVYWLFRLGVVGGVSSIAYFLTGNLLVTCLAAIVMLGFYLWVDYRFLVTLIENVLDDDGGF